MRRLLCALAVLAVLAGACGGRPEPEPSPSPSPSPTETASPSPPPSPSPTPSPDPVAALTGLPVEDPSVLDRPVLAVKVDNARAARPQTGLEAADIVLEELVEGGTTRFVALFNSADPGTVGPVRSGRDVDAQLLPAFEPVLSMAGAAPPTYAVLRDAGLRIADDTAAKHAYYRDPNRKAPYNLYANTGPLWAAAGGLPPAERPWIVSPAPQPGGRPTAALRLRFAPQTAAEFTWDAASGRWLRTTDGRPHTGASGAQLGAENVVVARVAVRAGGGVDVRGTATHDIQVTGEGEALVLRDGQSFAARWRKPDAASHFEWLTPDGAHLALAPGRTWVALQPVGAPQEIVPAG